MNIEKESKETSISGTINYDMSDYINFRKLYRTTKDWALFLLSVVIMLLLLAKLFILTDNSSVGVPQMIDSFLLILVMMVLIYITMPKVFLKMYSEQYFKQLKRWYDEPIDFTINETELCFICSDRLSRFSWKYITKCRTNKYGILLYMIDLYPLYLSRKWLKDDQQWSELIKLVKHRNRY